MLINATMFPVPSVVKTALLCYFFIDFLSFFFIPLLPAFIGVLKTGRRIVNLLWAARNQVGHKHFAPPTSSDSNYIAEKH